MDKNLNTLPNMDSIPLKSFDQIEAATKSQREANMQRGDAMERTHRMIERHRDVFIRLKDK